MAVEKLLGLEVPKRAQYIRVMMVELQRISSHLVWLGTHAIDLGAMSVFLYCFREREEILKIFEMFSGQRMMTSYIRIGGVALDPPAGWRQAVQKFLNMMPSRVDEYETLLTQNPIWIGRTKDIGYISPEDAIALSMTGPTLRSEEHTSELQSRLHLVCRLLLEKKRLDGGRALRVPVLPAAGLRDPPELRWLRADPDLRGRLPVAQDRALERKVRNVREWGRVSRTAA